MAATQIDPRGPRFGAGITNILSVVAFLEALDKGSEPIAAAIFGLFAVLFLIGTLYGTSKHPFGWIYRSFVKPRLAAPKELEDSRPPQFAQAVGLFVSVIGLVLFWAAVPYGIAIAAAALFLASALQAYAGFCLGCQMYLGLRRLGVFKA